MQQVGRSRDSRPAAPILIDGVDIGRNRLLGALPSAARAELAPFADRTPLQRGMVLHRAGDAIEHLYFPVDALISVTLTMRDGRTAETGIVGCREMVGVNALMGGRETTQTEYTVQIAGDVVRIAAAPVLRLFEDDRQVRHVFLKYTQAMLAQISQNAACNGLHMLEQRYARWLLETRDRVGADELRVTQEFISEMLSVRRAGVTEVSCRLEDRGILRQRRGRTRILDPMALGSIACECYQALADEYDRLLGRGSSSSFDGEG